MKQIELSIIIVSWNVKKLLGKCLKSIEENNQTVNSEVIVVDNASRDGSPEFVSRNFPWVKVIRNSENLGFSRANNIGIKNSSGKNVVFLNPDTLLLEDSFHKMVATFGENRRVGAIGCKLIDKEKQIDFHCATRFPTISGLIFEPYWSKLFKGGIRSYTMKEWNHETNRIVEVLSGACLMVRRSVLDKVGIFDEDIFMYVDDVDLCYRIKESGMELLYLADTEIVHYGKQSTNQNFIKMNAESIRSMRKFFCKHYSILYGVIFEIIMIINLLAKSILFSIANVFGKKRPTSIVQNYIKIVRELVLRP